MTENQPVANTAEKQTINTAIQDKNSAETEQQNVTNNGQSGNTEQKSKTLNDVLPGEGTNLVYISGMLQGQQVNCEGPIEYTRKLDHPQWPFIPALPQYDPSKCKTPTFDWGKGQWKDESEEARVKQLNDLTEKVASITTDVGKIQETQEAAAQEKEASDKKDDQVFKLISAMNVQLGVINTKLSQVTSKDNEASTKPAVSAQNTQNGTTTEGGAQ
ncbi:hypothetical protein [Lactobacillus crispatus]|uniref:hypothetical protein n=2 Tax=Lactobacillus crispatus TaxID=47770 RepID=UPI0001B29C6E|nr:hypothetical protein [Lactobacillus crispatus]STX15978.1 Uncharacterised protein [Lactobacillus acidophilus]EEU19768.1 hypothetical protein HMPREF5045_00446 [Lactobacillus crispatus 125-2-CHN]MCT3533532.1 hypothetical protein [Lactobacillus crispatus]MCZ3990110.1 hypothetical protein [Lactobacillus crispatus]MCZ3992293.1 hypothetical protein [Lactobacillus crispatus]